MCVGPKVKMPEQDDPIIPILTNTYRDGKQALLGKGYSALTIQKPATLKGVASQTANGLTIPK
jgi:hypothetical protein